MPTSSIFANFDIQDKEKAESFVRALELSEQDKKNYHDEKVSCCEYVTDSKRLHALFDKKAIAAENIESE